MKRAIDFTAPQPTPFMTMSLVCPSEKQNQVRKYEKSKRAMPIVAYLTFHFITTPYTHSNSHSTSEQRKDAEIQEKGSYRISCRHLVAAYSTKKTTATPTHF